MKENLDCLVIAPHPDDAEIFCGGLLAKLSKSYSLGIIDLSQGEMASNGSVPIRQAEAKKAQQILNVKIRANLNFPDTFIGQDGTAQTRAEQIEVIVKCLRLYRPNMVIIPYGDSRHPDHFHSTHLLKEALFCAALVNKFKSCGPRHEVKHVLQYMTREEFIPSFVVDITNEIEQKISSIESYQSQINPQNENTSSKPTLVGDPLSIHAIKARDAYFGSTIGVMYAEPFWLDSTININDPISFFSANGPNKSFVFKGRK